MNCYFINDIHLDKHLPDLTPGKKQSQRIHSWMNNYFLPADILCIAGDIADDHQLFIDFLSACRGMYKYVVFVFGNHEIRLIDNSFSDSFSKIEIMNIWIKGLTKINTSAFNVRTKFYRLDGKEIVDVGGIPFAGVMGSSDWSYCVKQGINEPSFIKSWNSVGDGHLWKWWSHDPYEIVADEKRRLKEALTHDPNMMPKIVVSHFAPLGIPVAKRFENKHRTGLCYWDVDDIINMLPQGTIWHFGHTHSKIKYEKNGILFLNNPIGFPKERVNSLGKFTNEDFLIEL